jgi:hypothetical protein
MQALLCRSFEELKSPLVEAFLTPNRGWGVKAAQPIQDGCFVVEYVGECLMLPPYHAKVPLGVLLDTKDALPCVECFTALHSLQRLVAE